MITLPRGLKRRLIVFVILNITTYIQVAWKYPLAEVSPVVDKCKSQHRSQLSDDCKIKFPIVTPTQYDTIPLSSDIRKIITVLYGATYTNQRDYQVGWSPGVDIATSKWTPVYSIGNGVVIYAGVRKWWDGNSISIVHNDRGQSIMSHYSHLDSIQVTKWQTVKAWSLIWTVGNSGRTIGKYGNHLDFQIDKKTTYSKMFGYYGCEYWYVTAVNEWWCREMMQEYTIDPLKFLADHKATLPDQVVPNTVSKVWWSDQNNIQDINTWSVHTNISPWTTSIKKISIWNTTTIPSIPVSTTLSTYVDGVKYEIQWAYPTTVIGLKKKLTLTLKVSDTNTALRNWALPQTIDLITSNNNINLNIETINYINGAIDIIITGKKIWTTNMILQMWDYQLANILIQVK
jgi:hypothetical protein